jgi:hypothetical protein
MRYELGFYIPKDGILHSHRRGDLRSYMYDVGVKFTNGVNSRANCYHAAEMVFFLKAPLVKCKLIIKSAVLSIVWSYAEIWLLDFKTKIYLKNLI